MQKREFPILEFDPTTKAVIEPSIIKKKPNFPKFGVFCFFNEVIDDFAKKNYLTKVHEIRSEMGKHIIYKINRENEIFSSYTKDIMIAHPGVGAPLAAGILEEVTALGCENYIAVGGAGVLDKDLVRGKIIIPISAVRDEGTSYHYLAPSREVSQETSMIQVIKRTLKKNDIDFIEGKTWSTDAFYRETKNKVDLRKEEGCLTVEMEASAFFAVAKFRKIKFGQFLYAGDDVSGDTWDNREWHKQSSLREKLLLVAIDAVSSIGE